MSNIKFKNICKLVNAETNKSIADLFVSDLQYSIRQQYKANLTSVASQSYKPSSLACIRNMYYQLVGTPIDEDISVDPEGVGIAESGTDRHKRIQEAIIHMKDSGIDCEYIDVETYIKEFNIPNLIVVEKTDYETKLFNTEYNFRFLCDGIIKYRGKYYILEIKTETAFKWNNRLNVDPSHYKQATAYALNFGINEVIFLYENRDTCAKKSYLYLVLDSQKEALIKLINECDTYVVNKELPPIPEILKNSNKTCNYCSYRKRCHSE